MEAPADFWSRTYTDGDLLENNRLAQVCATAEKALSALLGRRDALDAELADHERKADEREAERLVRGAERDAAAAAADVDATARAEAYLSALDRVDTAQAEAVERLGRDRQELMDAGIPEAEEVARAAREELESFRAERIEGRALRSFVNAAFAEAVPALVAAAIEEGKDAPEIARMVAAAPDSMAELMARPESQETILKALRRPATPAPSMSHSEAVLIVEKAQAAFDFLRREEEVKRAVQAGNVALAQARGIAAEYSGRAF